MKTGFVTSPTDQVTQDMAELVRNDVKSSMTYMTRFYSTWDSHWNIYKSRRELTAEQKDALAKGRLARVAVPLSYTQVEQAITFTFSLLTQKEQMFELTATDSADQELQQVSESLLHNNFNAENGLMLLPSLLRDFYVYGIAVVKDWWEEKTEAVPSMVVTKPEQRQGDIVTQPEETSVGFVEHVVSQGNKVKQISPYNFFPDPSVPLYAWETGRYVVTESEISPEAFKAEPSYKNKDTVAMSRSELSNFRTDSRVDTVSGASDARTKRQSGNIILSEWVGWLVPKHYKDPFGSGTTSLGKEDFPVRYRVVVANDTAVVLCEPYTSAHRSWPVSAAVFSPSFVDDDEMDSTVRPAKEFNRAVEWLISERGRSVARTRQDRLIIDPTGVEPASVRDETGNILLKRHAAGMDVRRYVTQLPFNDATQGHLRDAAELSEWSNRISGISEAQLGQISTGRRSASEMSAVINYGASRAKMVSVFFWEGLMVPLARRWLSRFRQSLSEEFFVLYCGEEYKPIYTTFHQDTLAIARSNDFWVFDGSLPSEKAYTARALQELLQLTLSNPSAAMTFGLSPVKLLQRIYELRGLGKLTNFNLTQEEMQAALGRLQQVQQTAQPAPEPTQAPV